MGEGEVIQAQHYNVGEYYKPHYDSFLQEARSTKRIVYRVVSERGHA
ncbi:hypothetical protein MGSAQ_000893 [marine sediment metagenome]|uniref:Prolyl 4-hydroxylase alpha subunit Fe(2+) 2OG dioxygenase domain-containing protein n=1 Tax=marine sediment metagenome TaxID=412755 RepID=A0A1B6NW96_9ZZZZ